MAFQGKESRTKDCTRLVLHVTQVPGSGTGPLPCAYAELSVVELDGVVRDSLAKCQELSGRFVTEFTTRLYPALLEMERRFKKRPGTRNDLKLEPEAGWHDYLRSRGVKPGTFRAWKSRHSVDEAQRHFFSSARTSNNDGKSRQRPSLIEQPAGEAQILADAAINLIAVLLDPMLDDTARLEKATRRAQEMQEAVSAGRIDTLSTAVELRVAGLVDDLIVELIDFVFTAKESHNAWLRIRELAGDIQRIRNERGDKKPLPSRSHSPALAAKNDCQPARAGPSWASHAGNRLPRARRV